MSPSSTDPILARFLTSAGRLNLLNILFQEYLKLKKMYPSLKALLKKLYTVVSSEILGFCLDVVSWLDCYSPWSFSASSSSIPLKGRFSYRSSSQKPIVTGSSKNSHA